MWKNLQFRGFVYFSLILNLISVLSVVLLRGYLPPIVPLFYGLPVDSVQLIPSLAILIAPTIGLTILAINTILSIFTKDIFLKRTLVVSQAFVSLLLGIAVLRVVILVGFFRR